MAKVEKNFSMKSYSRGIRTQKAVRTIVCIIFCLISFIPFFILAINATQASETIKQGVSFLPGKFLSTNWTTFLEKQQGMQLTLFKATRNSLIITIPSTLFAVYFSALTAYGIHVYNFKFKKFAWAFIMAVMMVPGQVTIIGYYRMMLKIGLDDNWLALILPCIAAPAVVFFMKQYLEATLSLEMIDAARIDGAREFRVFNTIILPIMKPAMATQAIFQFIASWNNLFTPTILLTTESKKPLPLFVQMLNANSFRVDYGVIYLALFITIIPLIIMYLLLSKFIIAGVALGGVKE